MTFVTNENFKEFVELYKLAVKYNQKTFMFYGQEVLTNYAKYLIQYVESSKNESKRLLP